MWSPKALLLFFTGALLLAPIDAGAYRIPFNSTKFQEGGLPSQHGAIDVEVGHLATTGIDRSEAIAMLEAAWDGWDDFLGSGLDWRFQDAGNVSFPWERDGTSSVQFSPGNGTWAAFMQTYGGVDEPWRVEELDLVLRECPEWCWVDCPAECGGELAELDLPTILRHELGHAIGLQHCSVCTPAQTVMVAVYDPGTCDEWTLGTEDRAVATDMYPHGADTHEPDDDLWSSPNGVGSLDADRVYDEIWVESWLANIVDVDLWECAVVGDPDDLRLAVSVIPPSDLDVAFELYRGSTPEALVDDAGTGQPEFFDVPAATGAWRVRVFCPDYESDTWSEDPYDLQLALYKTVAGASGEEQTAASIEVLLSPSRAPRIRLQGLAEGAMLTVLDVTGRTVIQQPIDEGARDWSAAGLPAGVYLASVRQGDSVTRRRFTVVR